MKVIITIIAIALMCSACSPTRYVVPLKAGEQQLSAALGGPLITYSEKMIPAPMISLSYGYGYDTNITLFGGVHVT